MRRILGLRLTLLVSDCRTALNKKEKPPMNVVGDVGGKIAIIVVSSHS